MNFKPILKDTSLARVFVVASLVAMSRLNIEQIQ